jgi:cytochrome c peroxidase
VTTTITVATTRAVMEAVTDPSVETSSGRAGRCPGPCCVQAAELMVNYAKRVFPKLRRGIGLVGALALLLALAHRAISFPIDGGQTVLPAGSELNEDAAYVPHEILHSEYRGDRTSYVVALGDLAFNSPTILGDVARRAGMSCGTCHVNGASNAKLFVPGMSTRAGTFDTTGPLFNPKANNFVLDPVRIPSLRGARYLAPYGHDGRIASLRDFVRNVIVGEFAGPEPSPTLLDAIVAYVREIDFLPNPRLDTHGRLNATATESERRGEALFSKPFPHDPNLSCVGCHQPAGAFVDHLQHDIGSGGLYKTPTLLNANFNAPYFHDGRYGDFDQVVEHFDRVFGLGLSAQDRGDLVAYLRAVGDAREPYDNDSVVVRFKDISNFSLLLAKAIAAHDRDTIELAVDTLGTELRELGEQFPDHRDTAVTGALVERRMARAAAKEAVISLRRIGMAASAGDLDTAATEYKAYYNLTYNKALPLMRGTEPWSLFKPTIRAAHDAQRRQMLRQPRAQRAAKASP